MRKGEIIFTQAPSNIHREDKTVEFDLDTSEELSDYVSVPVGTYLCQITEIRERSTRSGDPLWALCLVVAEGEYVGRHAAWDNLVFSTRGLSRVRRVFQALGLPYQGKVQLSPTDLKVLVEVRPAEYANASGTLIRRNEVPYDGYSQIPKQSTAEPGDDPVPF